MVDNVVLPAVGTGTTDIRVAGREVTYSGDTAKAQTVGIGLFSGSDDAKTIADVSTAAPFPIALPQLVRIAQTPTVSTTPAYTAKDAVGGLLEFANAARISGGSGIILTVEVVDLSQQRPSLELVLFDRTFTNSTDNAVFDPTDGDLANVLGVVAINGWSDFNDNALATVANVGLGFLLNGTSIFGQLVTRTTPTFVGTSDIKVILTIQQG